MRMPARGQEWPKRRRAAKVAQMGKARRVGPAGQMSNMTVREQTVQVGCLRVRRMGKNVMGGERSL